MIEENRPSVQGSFLNTLRRDKAEAEVITINGYHIRGFIAGFDSFAILMNVNGVNQLIYKSAISTIAPVIRNERTF